MCPTGIETLIKSCTHAWKQKAQTIVNFPVSSSPGEPNPKQPSAGEPTIANIQKQLPLAIELIIINSWDFSSYYSFSSYYNIPTLLFIEVARSSYFSNF